MPVDFDTVMKFLNQPTLIAFLIVFVMLGGYMGWYVYGPAHKREVKAIIERAERAEKNAADWQGIATKNADVAQRATGNNEVMMAMIQTFAKRNGG